MRIKVTSNHRTDDSRLPVMAATLEGTTYYYATKDELVNLLESANVNMWITSIITNYDLDDAIDLSKGLYGSKIEADEMWLCVTDGRNINVNGEEIDPESALYDYDIEELSAYIQPMTADIASKYITEYELDFNEKVMTDLATELLADGNQFTDLVKAAQDIDLIN